MKLRIWLIFSLLMVMSAPVSAVKSKLVTSEIGAVTKFHLAKNLNGFVKFKKCADCKTQHYRITPKIKAYLAHACHLRLT